MAGRRQGRAVTAVSLAPARVRVLLLRPGALAGRTDPIEGGSSVV